MVAEHIGKWEFLTLNCCNMNCVLPSLCFAWLADCSSLPPYMNEYHVSISGPKHLPTSTHLLTLGTPVARESANITHGVRMCKPVRNIFAKCYLYAQNFLLRLVSKQANTTFNWILHSADTDLYLSGGAKHHAENQLGTIQVNNRAVG